MGRARKHCNGTAVLLQALIVSSTIWLRAGVSCCSVWKLAWIRCMEPAARLTPTAPAPHLAAELASVLGVLADLHLLDDLTKAGTIAGTVLAHNPNLLCTLGLWAKRSLDERRAMGRLQACCSSAHAVLTIFAKRQPRQEGGLKQPGAAKSGRNCTHTCDLWRPPPLSSSSSGWHWCWQAWLR